MLTAFALVGARPAPAVAAPTAVAVTSAQMIRPTDAPAGASSIALSAARNEFESTQIVVRDAAASLAGVDVTVAGVLRGPDGATIDAASATTVYLEAYYDVTGYSSDGDLGGAKGRFADALIPRVDPYFHERRSAFPVDVPAGENRVAWIDLLVPAAAPAGHYTGAVVRVTRAGASEGERTGPGPGEPAVIAELPLTLDVLDLTMPSTPSLPFVADINPGRLCATGAHDCARISGGGSALGALYERAALDNRMSLAKPGYAPPASLADPTYTSVVRPVIMGSAATRLAGARADRVVIYQWAASSAALWKQLALRDGYADRVTFHCDEVGRSAAMWAACQRDWRTADSLWRSAPGTRDIGALPLQMTANIDDVAWGRANGYAEVADAITTMIPVVNHVHAKGATALPGARRSYDAWLAGGGASGGARRLYAYTSCMSMGCSAAGDDNHPLWQGWPSYGIDQPASEARTFAWAAFTYDLQGEYYYDSTKALNTAWTNSWTSDGGNHGDGTLFYPGSPARVGGAHDIPIESLRMKRIRDGREDYELMRAATLAGKQAQATTIVRSLVPTMFNADPTPARLDAARSDLIDLLGARSLRGADPITPLPDPDPDAGDDPDTGGDPPRPPRVTYMCAGRVATIVGTWKNDRLIGTPGNDVIVGLGGNDYIDGRGGNDIICGGGGHDVIRGGPGNDRILGGPGNDTLIGDAGRDWLDGGPGNDAINGNEPRGARAEPDVIFCGIGMRDRVLASRGDRVTASCRPRRAARRR